MSTYNNCTMMGRLTRDPDTRVSKDGKQHTSFSLAVQRTYKNPSGQYEADFIPCIAFGKTSELIDKFFKKGQRILVHGEWRTGKYTDKNGNNVTTHTLTVDDFGFIDKAGERPAEGSEAAQNSAPAQEPQQASIPSEFMSIPSGYDEELPFV